MCSDTILSRDELDALLPGTDSKESSTPKPDKNREKKERAEWEMPSQVEIENLLNMMNGILSKPKSDEKHKTNTNEVKDEYILVKPIDRLRMKTLQTLHNKFARIVTTKVSTMLQSVVEIKLISIDQLYYSEFVFSCDNPSYFNLIHVKSHIGEGDIILDINTSILFPMLERMLGGGGSLSTLPRRRSLTNIESRLAQRIIDIFLKELKTTWQKVIDLEFTVIQTESNPQFINALEPNEDVAILCFEVSLIEIRGSMVLCIPADVLDRLLAKETNDKS